ncbi:DDRGK domain-containing protein 1 isoform X3 [Hydra vulgaris]|uniref:DDRGK domain-containing protein 1 n=1 Tax=Hydra vulgaris TaxID=6087 RepID=A0ABM4CXA8_HYDVU
MVNDKTGKLTERTQYAAFIWLVLACVFGLLLMLTYYFVDKEKKKKKEKPVATSPSLEGPSRARIQRPRRMRVQRESENFERLGDDEEGPEMWDDDKPVGKIGAKKLKKLEMKAESREIRKTELEEREERKKRDILLAAEKKKEEELRIQAEAELAEKERLKKEEQERKENEEYLKLKTEFTVEESGDVGILSEEESQSLLQEFIDFIKNSKVVLLEDVASHFSLKTQEVIDRLENLQEMGRITGVMDDRGKFVYISEEELKSFAKFIKQRGRISIAELAESSNSLIKLEEANRKNVLIEAPA